MFCLVSPIWKQTNIYIYIYIMCTRILDIYNVLNINCHKYMTHVQHIHMWLDVAIDGCTLYLFHIQAANRLWTFWPHFPFPMTWAWTNSSAFSVPKGSLKET